MPSGLSDDDEPYEPILITSFTRLKMRFAVVVDACVIMSMMSDNISVHARARRAVYIIRHTRAKML